MSKRNDTRLIFLLGNLVNVVRIYGSLHFNANVIIRIYILIAFYRSSTCEILIILYILVITVHNFIHSHLFQINSLKVKFIELPVFMYLYLVHLLSISELHNGLQQSR